MSNCDLINNNVSTVIKLGTCAVNVYVTCYLNITHLRYLVLNVFLQFNSRTNNFLTYVYKQFFFVLMDVRCILWMYKRTECANGPAKYFSVYSSF